MKGRGPYPPLSGDNFMSRWEGRTIDDLLRRTQATMPQSRPGSLDAETYLNISIYLLEMNAMFFGEIEREADSSSLKRVPIRKMAVY
jgi:hypothetical protein